MAKTKHSNLPVVTTPTNGLAVSNTGLQGQRNLPDNVKKNLTSFIAPVQLTRIKQDVRSWREAIAEAEFAYYPQRVKMQRLFLDTALNGHVKACVRKRRRLTTQRQFGFFGDDGEEIVDITNLFKKRWFTKFMIYSIDAEDYGYSLIALGNVVNDEFPELNLVKRWNVSPDRFNVTSYIYANQGKDFRDNDVADWHVYVDTTSDDGASPCGYGLFYTIGLYEIFLRNILGFNGDFVERYSMPYVWAKTNKTDEDERGQLEQDLRNMGSNGYAITDPTDDISFLEAALAGTGWNGYDNLEKRCEAKISKLMLGHADALDSTPGKLGATQGDQTPASLALSETQSEDGTRIEEIVNNQLIPKMRNLGFIIPEGTWKFKNDDEVNETRNREDTSNKATADIAQVMKNAGLQMDAAYFEKRTGIPTTIIPTPAPQALPGNEDDKKEPASAEKVSDKIKNKLKKLYS
ncbi:DUF935 family protein [Mucilaginibacter gossypii]|uniref:phage portal protein family protein n=1 Tax=Mucilaginibacter gossypii TaxID=551996 RepID=UPI000DCB18B0|nr:MULTISPECIES: DUF935 family protein [Mucilaginibacter]QTE37492.1 DUF935 family protein [Mucilaginibacter gossypii]RAV52317.1 hypothetical protein DIU36_24595 [Mucilaginibacter rubeus]